MTGEEAEAPPPNAHLVYFIARRTINRRRKRLLKQLVKAHGAQAVALRAELLELRQAIADLEANAPIIQV